MTQSYTAADTVEEALAALANGARPVAGGTDLVVGARQGKAPLPDRIVAIDRLADLRGVVVTERRCAWAPWRPMRRSQSRHSFSSG